MFGGALAVYAGGFIEKRMRVDDAVGAVAVHGVCGFWSPLAVGLFAAGYPTGINNIDSSLTGQLYAMAVFLPLGFLGGYIPSWILKKTNLMRVPPEVELEGLDMAEFQTDFYPEFGRPTELIVLPDGTEVPSEPILLESYQQVTSNGTSPSLSAQGRSRSGWDSSSSASSSCSSSSGRSEAGPSAPDRRRRAENRVRRARAGRRLGYSA